MMRQRFDEPLVAAAIVRGEHAGADAVERFAQDRRGGDAGARVDPASPRGLDFARGQAKYEDIRVADEIFQLDIGAVERADRQRPVQRHLHVSGPGGFHARGRDLLGEIDRRDDHLGEADVVVRKKYDLELAAHGRVCVDGSRHVDRQLDDELGLLVARRRLAREYLYPRREVRRRIGPDFVVARDRLEDIEELPLVFVDALDLNVEQRVRIDPLVQDLGDLLGKHDLVGASGRRYLVLQRRIVRKFGQFAQRIGVSKSFFADRLGDDLCQLRVALDQPSAERDAIGLVGYAAAIDRVQIMKYGLLHQIGVQGRNAIDLVRADE